MLEVILLIAAVAIGIVVVMRMDVEPRVNRVENSREGGAKPQVPPRAESVTASSAPAASRSVPTQQKPVQHESAPQKSVQHESAHPKPAQQTDETVAA